MTEIITDVLYCKINTTELYYFSDIYIFFWYKLITLLTFVIYTLEVIDPFSPLSVQAPLPAATPAKPPTFPGRDFIPKHRIALETRLGLLQPIFLRLQDRGVLIDEEREEVVSKSTKTLQNQTLLDMVVKKGARAQEHFYQVLKEVDPCLVEDLEEQTVWEGTMDTTASGYIISLY